MPGTLTGRNRSGLVPVAKDPRALFAPRSPGGILLAMRAGLCDSCRHQKLIKNTRGATFSLCARSLTDPEYPKYPPLPVIKCRGYEEPATPAHR